MINVLLDRFIEITGALTGSIMLIDPEARVLEIKRRAACRRKRCALSASRSGRA